MTEAHDKLRALLETLAHEIATQDNAATSDPYYTVQQRVRDWGFEDGYGEDGFAWIMDSEEIDDPAEWCVEHECAPFDPDDPPDGMQQVNYRYRWEHVQAFLTHGAALAFMKREAHNHAPMRTWVESACRNREMRWVCALPARALEAIATAERERDEARAEAERLRAEAMAAGVHEHHVCPGCHVVDEEPCLPGCIDAEIEGERRTPFDGFSEFMADDEGDESEEGGDHG